MVIAINLAHTETDRLSHSLTDLTKCSNVMSTGDTHGLARVHMKVPSQLTPLAQMHVLNCTTRVTAASEISLGHPLSRVHRLAGTQNVPNNALLAGSYQQMMH